MHLPRALFALLMIACTLWAGCASAYPANGTAQSPSATTSSSGATKQIVIGILREPVSFDTEITGGDQSGGGANQPQYMVHNYLTIPDEHEAWVPQLAAAPLSIEAGTWQVNPDGTMDTTWKLRPNLKWQDGVPFTSDDLLFSLKVYKDPAIPNPLGVVVGSMASATAPDPQTFVVHWTDTYVHADQAQALTPLPRHLMEQAYLADKASFTSSTRFTTDFVGLGPYRLTRWVSGVEMDLARFDDYFMGRPPLDKIVVRFLSDASTVAANLLSGAIDVAPIGLDIDTAANLEQRWVGTGNHVLYFPRTNLRFMEIQYRPEYEMPHNALTNRLVREALYRQVDRRALNDVIELGKGSVADSWVAPNDALRAQLESAIPQYPNDPALSQQLLAQAGWQRGPDGVDVDQASGEQLEIQLWTQDGARSGRELSVIQDGWQSLGVKVDQLIVSAAQGGDREYRSTLTGVGTTGTSPDQITTDRYSSRSIPSAANRWVGQNRGGYSRPEADAAIDRFARAIDQSDRVSAGRDLIQQLIGQLAIMPLIWEVDSVGVLSGITGPLSNGTVSTWNAYQWDRT